VVALICFHTPSSTLIQNLLLSNVGVQKRPKISYFVAVGTSNV
jgi:hypothetical protein